MCRAEAPGVLEPSRMTDESDYQRRQHFQSGVAHSQAEAAEQDRAFWAQLSAEQKLKALWQMVENYYRMGGAGAPRFDRTAAGVRRR